jgi:uncharacterized SAM-binding protein YcdF (DUF218 family)
MTMRRSKEAIVDRGGLTRLLSPARIFLLSLGPLLAVAYFLALRISDPLLSVRGDWSVKADIIVVLGGDGPTRALFAAKLWHEGIAPRVLVSGDGDCMWIRKTMIDDGVTPSAITTECLSGNTWQNATFTAPMLREDRVRSAVLVTSWFHSKRAMMCFTRAAGDIHWTSLPVGRKESYFALAFSQRGLQVLKEYAKLPLYFAWLALLPPLDPTPDSQSGMLRT